MKESVMNSTGIICLLETASRSRHSLYIIHQPDPDIVYSSINTLPVSTSCNWFILIQQHVAEENSDCILNVR